MSDALLKVEDFEPHVGTGFAIHTNEHVEILSLTAAEPGKPAYPGSRDSFALLFTGSSNDLMIHSQMVKVKHEVMGELEILISPFGRNEDGFFCYEAVFN